jgi:transposase
MNNSTAFKLAQLPTHALRVGVDPHKRRHAVVVRTDQAQILTKFTIVQERTAFEALLQRCEQFRQQSGSDNVVFAIEPGGHYWRNLGYFLVDHAVPFRLINPFTLKRQRDGDDLTHRKTDYRDAEMAADLLGQGKYTWTALPQGKYAELRQAHDTYQQLREEITRTKLQLTTALDALFPEFRRVFKQLDGRTALTILRTGAPPARLAAVNVEEWLQHLRRAHGPHPLMQAKARALQALAARSVGIQAGAEALTRQVQLLAERLTFLVAQGQQAEAELTRWFHCCEESRYLLSLRGLGVLHAAGLLAHIGEIGQYSGVKQLSKLAGITPTEDTSADHHRARTPMSKKGRRGLRAVLWRAVISLLRHNEVFAQYVHRLTHRPAPQHPLKKREAIGAAMNKLLRIVYALLKKQALFDPATAQRG